MGVDKSRVDLLDEKPGGCRDVDCGVGFTCDVEITTGVFGVDGEEVFDSCNNVCGRLKLNISVKNRN